MNTTFDEKKFLGITRFMSVLSKILAILLIIAMGGLVIGLVVISFLPSDVLTVDLGFIDGLTFSFMNIEFRMAVDLFDGDYAIKTALILSLIAALVSIAFVYYIIRLLHLILVNVSNKKPFSESNVKYLFNMSYTFIIMSVTVPIFIYIAGRQVVNMLDIDASISYGISSGPLFIGILIWILASIFQYGKYLQDEVDQTV